MTFKTLAVPSDSQARTLRTTFRDAGYDELSVEQRIGVVGSAVDKGSAQSARLESVRDDNLLNLLIRLFSLSEPVAMALAQHLAGTDFVDACLASGLLEASDTELLPRVVVLPHGELLIAGDRHDTPLAQVSEPVLPVNAPAKALLDLTLNQPVESLLDLCSGGGVQALASAARARQVVATDLNERAVLFAQLNAQLNDFHNMECLQGDGFAPVVGRRFEHIVCNPPFVLAPGKRFMYSDSGAELDDFCRNLVEQAPGFLAEGGYFQMIFEWVQPEGEDWKERLAEWVRGNGCDVWFLSFNLMLPETNADMHAVTMAGQSMAERAKLRDEISKYLRENHVEAVHGGFVMMRRRRGENWLSFTEVRSAMNESSGGEWVAKGFRARDYLNAETDPGALFRAKPRLADGVEVEQSSIWSGEWKRKATRLRTTQGLPVEVTLDADVVEFVTCLTGANTVGELCAVLERKTARPLSEVEGEAVALVRRLIALGVVEPGSVEPGNL